ncbi:unnamed protein product [Rotaria sp. Silwood1]|nr:unnamed protein product [Rotaria sp. Silwood1]CAF3603991.1 unnamed protein product [Rotaria sp. Silwood1]CAF4602655.1 unnamed protein product [Rotaria sp. Silwood1]CAF5120611.1 unnamed protein product [Rotaria sp. Silwood1]
MSMMKFEFLRNEILIVCFGYFNALAIFRAFDQLNYRFRTLIQHIPLYLSFEHVSKPIFDKFCKNILSNPDVKIQIYLLRLSNEDVCS